ncbi:hypothetical protein JXM83_03435 [Candidatus Woesearchaeota archaeon]|nr:hypothetical protein [Candidatus Woesearchaeota archaeon]
MRKLNFAIFAITLLLLSISIVNASGEFDVFAQSKDLSICSCSPFIDQLLIRNLDSSENTFYITISGSGAKYITSVPQPFKIDSYGSKEVTIGGAIPCGINEDLELQITILTAKYTNKTILRELSAIKCDPIGIFAKGLETTSTPCTQENFKFAIKNQATYKETFSIATIDSLSDFVDLPNNFSLLPNEIKEFTVPVKLSCDYNGEQIIPLTVKSKYTPVEKTLDLKLNIESSYDFEITGDDSIEQCTEDISQIKVKITNKFKDTNNFSVALTGHDFLTLNETSFSLESLETKEIILTLDTKDYTTTGDYNFDVVVQEKLGQTTKDFSFSIKLNDCYDFKTNLKIESDVLCQYEKEYDFTVENVGDSENFNIYFDKEYPFLTIDEATFDLDSKDSKDLLLKLDPTKGESGTYNISVITVLGEGTHKTIKTSSFVVELLPLDTCYQSNLFVGQTIFEEQGIINFVLKNYGFYDDTIKLNLTASNEFTISTDEIELPKDAVRVFNISFVPTNKTEYKTYDLDLLLTGVNSENVQEKIIKITYDKAGTFTSRLIALLAIFLVVGIFAGMKSKENSHGRKVIAVVFLLSVIIAIISIFLINKMSIILQTIIFVLCSIGMFLLSYLLVKVIKTIDFKKPKQQTDIKQPRKRSKKSINIFEYIFYAIIIAGLSSVAVLVPQLTGFALLAVGIFVSVAAIIKYFTLRKEKIKTVIVPITKEGKVVKKSLLKKVAKEAKPKQKPKPKQPRKPINFVPLFKILGVLLILFFSGFGIYESLNTHRIIAEQEVDTFLNQSMFYGEPKIIELGKYFKDPDNDTLTYNITTTNSTLKTQVLDELLYLNPKETGIFTYAITASDDKGANSVSPDIILNVKTARLSLLGMFLLSISFAIGLTNLILIFIVIGLVLLALIKILGTKKEPKKEKQVTKRNKKRK